MQRRMPLESRRCLYSDKLAADRENVIRCQDEDLNAAVVAIRGGWGNDNPPMLNAAIPMRHDKNRLKAENVFEIDQRENAIFLTVVS